MTQERVKQFLTTRLAEDGLVETAIPGVRLFRVTSPVPCAPAIYEPTVVAIASGTKQAIVQGRRHVYGASHYLACPMSMPVEAGAPEASPDDPLLGVMISLDARMMTELVLEMERAAGPDRKRQEGPEAEGLFLARWDGGFSDALCRLLKLLDDPLDSAVLGRGRLRELCYAILGGDAGAAVQRAFQVGNEIARAIQYLSDHLNEPVTVEELAARAGMSRAVFHRRFKEATRMSPIQFVKTMRLNSAAMKIAAGEAVSRAAWDVGYTSLSQFSREFRRLFGQSPRQWSRTGPAPDLVV